MPAKKRTLREQLQGKINQGRDLDLLIPIADLLEEEGDPDLARRLRLVHTWGLHFAKVQNGQFWNWAVGQLYLPPGVFERMKASRQYATHFLVEEALLYRQRWDAYLAMAKAWEEK